jgi:hypothetical protein
MTDGTLHSFMLPSLEPLPSTTIQTLRGVVNVVLNDDELDWGGPGSEAKATDMTVIVVRRKGLGVYRVGARMLPVKVSFYGLQELMIGTTPAIWSDCCRNVWNIALCGYTIDKYLQSNRFG